MNASTTAHITKEMAEYRRTETFRKFFQTDFVYEFFGGMLRYQSVETMDAFAKYHTEDRIKNLFSDIFPPPDLYEIWNAWDRKGRP
jgi:hypothetical protein